MTGAELRERRNAMEMTQEQMAKALSVDVMTVSRWERGIRAIPPYLALALDTVARNTRKRGRGKKRR